MGNFFCVCGNIISDVCGCEGYLCKEDEIEYDSEIRRDVVNESQLRSVFECDKCGTLIIQDPIDSCNHKFYIPENKSFNNLL